MEYTYTGVERKRARERVRVNSVESTVEGGGNKGGVVDF